MCAWGRVIVCAGVRSARRPSSLSCSQGNPVYIERTGRGKLHVMLPQVEAAASTHWKVYMQELGEKLTKEAGVETAYVIMDMDGLKIRNATKQVWGAGYQWLCTRTHTRRAHSEVLAVYIDGAFACIFNLRFLLVQVLDFYKYQGAVDEANYPETLKKIFVINAGWVFLSIWKFAKYFFAEEIRQKV